MPGLNTRVMTYMYKNPIANYLSTSYMYNVRYENAIPSYGTIIEYMCMTSLLCLDIDRLGIINIPRHFAISKEYNNNIHAPM